MTEQKQLFERVLLDNLKQDGIKITRGMSGKLGYEISIHYDDIIGEKEKMLKQVSDIVTKLNEMLDKKTPMENI